MNSLQHEILRAHADAARGERGAKARLQELQRQFREGRHLIDRYPDGATATLIEPGTVTSLRLRRKPPRAVARSQGTPSLRPYWQLTERESWRLR